MTIAMWGVPLCRLARDRNAIARAGHLDVGQQEHDLIMMSFKNGHRLVAVDGLQC